MGLRFTSQLLPLLRQDKWIGVRILHFDLPITLHKSQKYVIMKNILTPASDDTYPCRSEWGIWAPRRKSPCQRSLLALRRSSRGEVWQESHPHSPALCLGWRLYTHLHYVHTRKATLHFPHTTRRVLFRIRAWEYWCWSFLTIWADWRRNDLCFLPILPTHKSAKKTWCPHHCYSKSGKLSNGIFKTACTLSIVVDYCNIANDNITWHVYTFLGIIMQRNIIPVTKN